MCRKLLKVKMVGALVASLVFFMAVGYAEEERTDAGGQWKYVLENGCATITGNAAEPGGDLVIPGELDGHPVTGIGDNALDGGQSLISVAIPDSVTSIGLWTFLECRSLISIDVSSNNAVYAQIDGVLFDKSQKKLLSYPAARKGAYAVPEGVTHIEANAFGGCVGLTDVTIPGSVASMGDYAFQNCENLTSVIIEKGLTHISFGAFSNCGSLQAVAIPDSVTNIDVTAFVNCGSLDNVTIPDSVTSIGDEAFFECSGMTNVTIPDSITHIGDRVFYMCTGMTGVTIPESVTSIGEEAFFGCDSLRSVTVPASVTDIGEDAFAYCKELTLIVGSGSIAEQYAQENRIPYTYTGASGNPVGIAVSKRTDASRQWRYVLENDEATVTGFVEEPVGDLVIPGELDGYPVSGIGDKAFGECWNVTSVTIPAGVAHIGDWAFSGCMYLKSVTIPEGVTSIGNYAFVDCRGLPSVTIPASVTSIGTNPFAPAPFEGNALENIDVAPGNPRYEAIDGVLFDKQEKMLVSFPGARGGAYTIPEGVLVIGRQAFSVCWELTDVTIPDSVTNIGDWAFAYCDELTDVIIPNGVTRIGEGAFYACSGLLVVTVPESVTEIGEQVFDGCDTLALVVTEGGVAEQYAKENGIPYMFAGSKAPIVVVEDDDEERTDASGQWMYVLAGGGAKITGCAKEPSGDLVIPGVLDGYSVTGIGDEAIYGFDNLTSCSIPDSVTSIGDYAFLGCSSLTSIGVSPDNPAYAQIDGVLFDKSRETLLFYPPAREGAYTIPEGVLQIGSAAFTECSGLTGVTIPDSITGMGDYAFQICKNLTSATIGNGVTQISTGAFSECDNLTFVTIPDSVTSIGDYAFYGCGSLTILAITSGVTSIGDYAFHRCSALTRVNIPEGVNSIGEKAFWQCSGLTDLVIPGSVTSIGYGAFAECGSLTSATIAEGVPGISAYAFYKCHGLTGLDIPDSVTSIGSGAFCGCTGLTSLVIPEGVTEIADRLLAECSDLVSVTLPGGATSIGEYALYYCSGLTNVTIPSSVTSIGEEAFAGCEVLTLSVARDSAGEQYAKDNRMPYVFIGNIDAGKGEADQAVLERGSQLMEAQDFDGALAHFDAAIAENVGVAEYHAKRAEALVHLDRGADAERAYAKAVQIEPDNARYWDEYGGIMMFLNGKYQEAYEAIGKAVALEPSNGEYISDHGIALFYMGRSDEALAELERGIELSPDYARAYDFASFLQYGQGAFEEAILLCEKGLAIMPDYDALFLTLGDAKFGLGHYAEAIEAYERAFSIGYFSADDAENYGPAKRAVAAEKAAEGFAGDLEEITVSTAEELLSALGSNRRILLEEGVYNLTIAEPGFSGNANVYFQECYEGSELVLDGVHNLTIQCAGDARSEIIVEPRDASVVRFLNCTNIRIEGITAGHTEGGACGGGVFAFDYCAGITVEGTQMYGCGTIGLDLYWSAGIEAIGSTIYECTSGAMYMKGCTNVSFQDCVFRENTGDIMVYVEATSNVTIDSCSFLRNAGEQAMFSISESENVVVKNTEFIGNDVRELIYLDHKETEFDASNRFENNAFD